MRRCGNEGPQHERGENEDPRSSGIEMFVAVVVRDAWPRADQHKEPRAAGGGGRERNMPGVGTTEGEWRLGNSPLQLASKLTGMDRRHLGLCVEREK